MHCVLPWSVRQYASLSVLSKFASPDSIYMMSHLKVEKYWADMGITICFFAVVTVKRRQLCNLPCSDDHISQSLDSPTGLNEKLACIAVNRPKIAGYWYSTLFLDFRLLPQLRDGLAGRCSLTPLDNYMEVVLKVEFLNYGKKWPLLDWIPIVSRVPFVGYKL